MKVNIDLDYIMTLYQKIINFLMLVFFPWLGKIMSLFLEAIILEAMAAIMQVNEVSGEKIK